MLRIMVLMLSLTCGLIVRAQEKPPFLQKLSPALATLQAAPMADDSIDVSVAVKKGTTLRTRHRILALAAREAIYLVRLPAKALARLAQAENVLFINQLFPAKEELNTGASDPTLNQLTYVQHRYPALRGEQVVSSVKERLFDTTDIDFKGRVFTTGLENVQVTTHASLMTTIMAGAANSSPFARGAAPAARLTSSSFTNLFPDPDSIFKRHNISVQNHSYGTVVESFYGNEAVAYDQNAASIPTLLHVFSAGNSGTATAASGPYAGLPGLATLTGNFKQAKNVLTVSAVDSAAKLLAASSKGPAYDGRVKPEMVAYGEDGSSGAAALVSGAAILVQDAYVRFRGTLPAAHLTRAVLLNSAGEAGPNGLDYLSGYGLLNAAAAVQTVVDNRFFEGNLAAGETASFSLAVPDNAAQLKLTLSWTDAAAQPNAGKALVNDLDLELVSADGQTWRPWVLNPQPSATTLLQPAVRSRDTLNNNEQVSIESPPAGNYTVRVQATRLQTATQSFALAYQVDTVNTLYWTYPTASDAMVAGSRQMVRWQSNLTAPCTLEWATAGENWRPIGTVDSLTKNYFRWTLPDTATKARLRLVAGGLVVISDTFTISPQLSLQTGFNCADSLLLYWRQLGVQQYRLYRLGEKYLEPVRTLTDTSIVLQKAQNPSLYYAVAPLIDGKEAIRSNTVAYQNQGVGCYLRSFYAHSQSSGRALLIGELGTLYNVTAVRLDVLTPTGYAVLRQVNNPQATRFEFSEVPVRPGENRFRFVIQLQNGATLFSEETIYTVDDAVPVFVYPNPVRHGGQLTILAGEVGRYTLFIFDVTGRQHLQLQLNEAVTTLPASRLAKGVYFVQVMDQHKKIRVLKQVVL